MRDLSVPPPRAAGPGRSGRTGRHLVGWVWMRVSGAVLVVLVLAHLTVNLVLGDGINAINFALVAGRWSNPFWQLWSLVMLWLAMLHGAHGMSTIIDDYAETPRTRLWLKGLLLAATVVTLVLGSLVVLTFDPCPPTADPGLLPSFCAEADSRAPGARP
ncbi:succinate dehydrogenase hydrophobic membrane anchor subunit [uncultured Cellulomonas sp.]|uniref:succinate dehydrogenase hydrophobic membrane anchor subunit n=1 Tax=uncultured Cellulomonas sp. TaxID=189682 RepID=UPI00261E642D|nr:succinate dehydrogenase hydrophobic membrane anchor subunit [uncultured Cellulomonas sp.]